MGLTLNFDALDSMKTLLKTLIGYVITASILSLLVMWVQMDLYPLTDDPDDQSIYSIVIGMLLASALYIWNDIEGRKLAQNPPPVTKVQDTKEAVDMKDLNRLERRFARVLDKAVKDPQLDRAFDKFNESADQLKKDVDAYSKLVNKSSPKQPKRSRAEQEEYDEEVRRTYLILRLSREGKTLAACKLCKSDMIYPMNATATRCKNCGELNMTNPIPF